MADTPSSRPASPSTSPEGLAHHLGSFTGGKVVVGGVTSISTVETRHLDDDFSVRRPCGRWTSTTSFVQSADERARSRLRVAHRLWNFGIRLRTRRWRSAAGWTSNSSTCSRLLRKTYSSSSLAFRGAVSTANSARMSVDRTAFLRRRSTPGIAPPPGPHLQLRTDRREHAHRRDLLHSGAIDLGSAADFSNSSAFGGSAERSACKPSREGLSSLRNLGCGLASRLA